MKFEYQVQEIPLQSFYRECKNYRSNSYLIRGVDIEFANTDSHLAAKSGIYSVGSADIEISMYDTAYSTVLTYSFRYRFGRRGSTWTYGVQNILHAKLSPTVYRL